jgi:hypothetical protein
MGRKAARSPAHGGRANDRNQVISTAATERHTSASGDRPKPAQHHRAQCDSDVQRYFVQPGPGIVVIIVRRLRHASFHVVLEETRLYATGRQLDSGCVDQFDQLEHDLAMAL